ncbi:MAG TPA: sodium:proton antiporter [Solirubrobacteraceae bacterium]
MPTFQATVAVFGAILILGALVSGLAERSLLSLTALFVIVGFIVGDGGLQWIDFRARAGFVTDLAFAALIVILFRDGLEVEAEMLQRSWRLPLRKLMLAMPITAGIVAAAAKLLFGLSWTESLLLGALLSPTDPVLTSSIVTNKRVPRFIRHSLNLESGLNDGLALPAVLAFAAALNASTTGFVWWRFVLEDLGLGLLFGLACGYVACLLLPMPEGEESRPGAHSTWLHRLLHGEALFTHEIPNHQKSLYALGVAFATYGVTVLSPEGNGFIAVFVAAIVLGVRRKDLVTQFEHGAAAIVEIVKLGIFLLFGSLLTLHALGREGWVALGFVAICFFIARPLAVWLSLLGTKTDTETRLFMGWFGPKGVATMTFSLLIVDQPIAAGQRLYDIAALVVLCSIVIHGASDTPGANWIARRAERKAERESEAARRSAKARPAPPPESGR